VNLGLLDLVKAGVDEEIARKLAIALIAGPACAETELPSWPLSTDQVGSDEYYLAALAKRLDLDEDGYEALVEETLDLLVTPRFKRLQVAVAAWLAAVPRMDRAHVAQAMSLAWL
jgi:hypothetical protein